MESAFNGTFYFLTDDYFEDFPDPYLMKNKETIQGNRHGRPCYFAFRDEKTELLWMIPISSQVQKYRPLAEQKSARSGRCDTILFGTVLGHEKAFLIQNMCPATEKYLASQYKDPASSVAVRLDGALEKKLIQAARRVLALVRQNHRLIFPDVLAIEKMLLS